MENFIERHKRRFEPGGIFVQGYGTLSKQVMQDEKLDRGAKLLYAYLCAYAGEGNTCYPSRDKICRDLNIRVNTFTKYRNTLLESGYVRISKVREDRNYLHNVYTVMDCVPDDADESEPCTKKEDIEKEDIEKVDIEKVDIEKEDLKNEDTINNNTINNKITNNSIIIDPPATEEKEDKKKKGSRRFVKPALEEIKNYCTERCSTVDPEAFYDFYEMNGWVQGKDKPIRDWQAAVRNWERRDREAGKKSAPAYVNPADNEYDSLPY